MTPNVVSKYGWAVVFALCGVVVILLLVSVGQSESVVRAIRAQQVTNTHTTQTDSETLTLIRSCTTPGQSCYERGQSQTASAVANINRVVILAAACAARRPGQTIAQVQACVVHRLAKH